MFPVTRRIAEDNSPQLIAIEINFTIKNSVAKI